MRVIRKYILNEADIIAAVNEYVSSEYEYLEEGKMASEIVFTNSKDERIDVSDIPQLNVRVICTVVEDD